MGQKRIRKLGSQFDGNVTVPVFKQHSKVRRLIDQRIQSFDLLRVFPVRKAQKIRLAAYVYLLFDRFVKDAAKRIHESVRLMQILRNEGQAFMQLGNHLIQWQADNLVINDANDRFELVAMNSGRKIVHLTFNRAVTGNKNHHDLPIANRNHPEPFQPNVGWFRF